MPRYDDRYGNTRLYVGRISSRTRSRDLEKLFSRYGRVRDVDMKHDYAFIEFSDPRDADDARYSLDGREFDGSRIIVEFAKGVPRGEGGSRGGYLGRGPPPGSGRCFNCGIDGHWARDCKAGDWKNKCYRCGERGHIEKNCQNSPKKLRRGKSYSRSPSRSPSPRRRSHSRSISRSRSHSQGRSYSRSRTPPSRRERSVEHEKGSRSPGYDRRSPDPRTTPSRERKHSSSPDDMRRVESASPPVEQKQSDENNGSEHDNGRNRSRSPVKRTRGDYNGSLASHSENVSAGGRYNSPEINGRSPSPREEVRDDEVDSHSSPPQD